jgi:ribosomal protein S18 acetylase RimI-like enzyme
MRRHALESWAASQDADLLGLQVVESNLPAIRLYTSQGFTAGARNRFWVRSPRQ